MTIRINTMATWFWRILHDTAPQYGLSHTYKVL